MAFNDHVRFQNSLIQLPEVDIILASANACDLGGKDFAKTYR
jgi:hypothetical protein